MMFFQSIGILLVHLNFVVWLPSEKIVHSFVLETVAVKQKKREQAKHRDLHENAFALHKAFITCFSFRYAHFI
jgi:hypothetical protein